MKLSYELDFLDYCCVLEMQSVFCKKNRKLMLAADPAVFWQISLLPFVILEVFQA